MNIKEILVVILKHMDEISVYCYYHTSKTNKKILSEFIQTKIINVNKKNIIYKNLCNFAAENGHLKY